MQAFPKPERRQYAIDGGTLSGVHFGRTENPVKLVFLHANGFNAYAYKELLEPLGIHAVSLDLPGHGFTDMPTDPAGLRNFKGFARNVADYIAAYLDGPVCVAGHSLGAATAIILAAQSPHLVKAVTAFDPPVLSSSLRAFLYLPGGTAFIKQRVPIIRNAGRRRAEFDSLEAAFTRYKGRGTFRGFSEQALRDYLTGGLVETDTGVRLACDPIWEQAIFAAHRQNLFHMAKALPENSRIVFAGKDSPATASVRAKMAKIIGPDQYIFKPDFFHLFPLQEPEFARSVLSDMLKRASLMHD